MWPPSSPASSLNGSVGDTVKSSLSSISLGGNRSSTTSQCVGITSVLEAMNTVLVSLWTMEKTTLIEDILSV